MADTPNPLQQIQKPETAAPPSAEPAYFVMPPEYRHGAVGKKMAQPKAEPPKAVTVTPPPPVPSPVAPPPPGAPKKRGMARHTKVLIVAGVILLVGLSVGGYLVLNSLKTPPVAVSERPAPAATRPAPVTETPKPVETKPQPTTETPPATQSPFPTASTPGVDSDSDGLTDLEEKLIYGTNSKLPDTDSDGFLDGNEVFHRYNPAGTAPGTLVESGLVKTYTGPAGDSPWYRLAYPSVWSIPSTPTDWGTPTTIVATTGEKITVTVLERTQGTPFSSWLATVDPKTTFAASTTKNGYDIRTSDDQLTVYVDGSATSSVGAKYAVKLQYEPGVKTTIDYLQTFKMMTNSLEWL